MRKETRIATRKTKSNFGLRDKESLERIGRTIRAVRALRGWTQADLASKVHASQNHLCNIENGNREPGILLLLAIARSLGVSIDLLVLPAMKRHVGRAAHDAEMVGRELRNLLAEILDDATANVNEKQ